MFILLLAQFLGSDVCSIVWVFIQKRWLSGLRVRRTFRYIGRVLPVAIFYHPIALVRVVDYQCATSLDAATFKLS